MIKLFFALMLMVSGVAHADWNGNWAGSIAYTNDEGADQPLDITVAFTSDSATLGFVESAFGMEYSFGIADGKLYLDGAEVGTITDDQISIRYLALANENCFQSFEISMSNGSINYLDNFKCDNGYFDDIKGSLAVATARSFSKNDLHRR